MIIEKVFNMNIEEQAVFFRQFATMVSAGMPILKCLEMLKKQARTRYTKELLEQMSFSHAKGESLSEIAARYKIFSPFILGMLKAGESSGDLDVRMSEVADFLERINSYRKQLLSKLAYPFLVINFSFFFLPIHYIISGSLHKYFISLATFAGSFYAGIGFLLLIRYFLLKQEGSAEMCGGLILHLPIVGPLMKAMAIQRFLTVYGSFFDAGINVKTAIATASASTGNAYLIKQLRRALNIIDSGRSPAQALSSLKLFPFTAQQLLLTGETTGNSGEMAKKSAKYMETEITAALDRLTATLPPFVLIITGLYIGYNLVTSYSGYINQMQNMMPTSK